MACPNINSKPWKDLVAKIGTFEAFKEFIRHGEQIPDAANYQQTLQGTNATLKIVQALSSPKIEGFFKHQFLKGNKEKFFQEVSAIAGKQQTQLLKDHLQNNTYSTISELTAGLLAETSFTVTVNTAKEKRITYNDEYTNTEDTVFPPYEKEGKYYAHDGVDEYEIDKKHYDKYFEELAKKNEEPTKFYSNLTVPGGTNYRENEIATPAITPSIKGHAEFATNYGIGWFRSDDKISHIIEGEKLDEEDRYYNDVEGWVENKQDFILSKTRRILEVQSDLFQKGRDKEDLINLDSGQVLDRAIGNMDDYGQTSEGDYLQGDRVIYKHKEYTVDSSEFDYSDGNWKYTISRPDVDDYDVQFGVSYEDLKLPTLKTPKEKSKNQFLQLLNKDNNWVTFFVKSIIQDSAKKGYEKVLFPTGNTASKVEGHTTLEEFKKQQEESIQKIQDKIDAIKNRPDDFIKEHPRYKQIQKEIKEISNGNIPQSYSDYTNLNGKLSERESTFWHNGQIVMWQNKKYDNIVKSLSKGETQNQHGVKFWVLNDTLQKQLLKEYQDKLLVEKINIDGEIEKLEREKDTYKQELERVETEGFGALKPIYKFYEETVQNVLNKRGYQPTRVTDEYGNTWNEITLQEDRDTGTIYHSEKEISTKTYTSKNEKLTQYLQEKKISGIPKELNIRKILSYIEAFGNPLEKELAKRYNSSNRYWIKNNNITLQVKRSPFNEGIWNGDTGVINISIDDINNTETFTRILLHELIHSSTYGIIERYLLSDFYKEDRSRLQELYDIAKKEIGDEYFYGLTNLHEFVTETMTKPSFQKRLAQIKYKSTNDTILSRFTKLVAQWFRKFLGIDIQGTLLLEVLTEIDKFNFLQERDVSDIPAKTLFSIDEEAKEKQKSIAHSLEKKRKKYGVVKVEKTLEFQDDEGTGYKRMKDGVLGWVSKRVTDFVKEKKSAQTLAKFENAPKERKREWKEKAEWGTKFHKDSETIIKAALTTEGYLKEHKDIRMSDIETSLPTSAFQPMFDYLVGSKEVPGILYTQFPQGTLFRIEEILYDEKRDVAGTVDLMGITPEGKIHIIDWKTKFLNKQYYDDVPFFNQRDYRVQLGQYKNVLKTYGIKPEDVSVAQAQPVVFEGSVSKEGEVKLTAIELPQIDVRKEARKYLIPVSVEEQSTGNEAIDSFIDSLYRLYEDVYRTPTQDKYLKIQQLNSIASAIRELQIKQNFAPVAQEAQNFMFSVDRAIKDYNDLLFKDNLPIEDGFENITGGKEAFDHLLSRVTTILENINKYSGLYGMFDDVYGAEDLTEEQQKVADTLKKIAGDAAHKAIKIENAFKGMMEWFAKRYGVDNILQAEKTVTGAFDRNVQSTSRIQTYAIELFYKLESEAKSKRDVAVQEKLSSFKSVLEPFKKWAAGKGLSPKDFFSILTGDVKSNKLLAKLKKEVYQKLEEATNPKALDKAWIEQNVNMDRVKKIAAQKIATFNKSIDGDKYSTDPEEDNKIKKEKKDNYAAQWDFSDTGLGWYQVDELRRNIKEELWYTDEFKKLKGQPEALALYNWIEQFNDQALRAGYHDHTYGFSRRFLPWVRGSFMDKLGRKGLSAFSDTIKDIYTLHEEEQHLYGKGEAIELPRFFTKDNRTDKESLSELSTDIGANMALYIQSVLDHQAMSEIEDYADAILTLEKAKDHLVVGKDGRILQENGKLKTEQGNEENARLLQSQVEMLLYKRMYDKTSGLPEEANKAIEKMNNFMRLKVFSLNVIMPFVNTIGSNLQAGINSGRLFKGREWLKNEAKLLANLFEGQEGNLIKGMVDYFMPLLESENHRTGKQLSLQALKKWTVGDVLLGHIRKADRIVQLTTAMTMLENTMVDPEGNLMNIREHYLNSPEYRNRYKLPIQERKALERGFEKRVAELKEQHSILKKAKFNSQGILEIEGVDRNSETYHQYRRKIQNEISNIVGQISEDEKRDMERNILLKSMMMFKSWIPNLAQKRFGQLQKNARTDQYEIGRARVFFSLLFYGAGEKRAGNIFGGVIQGLKDLRDMRAANERGVQLLSEYYDRMARDYYEKTGKELQLTPEEFYDLTRQAIAMQAKDLVALSSLILMGVGIASIPPDEDDDKGSKNIYRTVSRIADKLKDEVTFYYNPLSAKTILGGGLIPSIGVITDALGTLGTIGKDLTSPEDVQEKTYSTKAILKNFPIFYQGTQFFLPLISPETADDLGVRVAANNNYR